MLFRAYWYQRLWYAQRYWGTILLIGSTKVVRARSKRRGPVRKFIILMAMALSLLGVASTAWADPIVAYDNRCDQYQGCSNQNFGNSLGLDFQVLEPIEVLAMGMYNGSNNERYIYAGKDQESGIWVQIYRIDAPVDGQPCSTNCNPTLITSVHFDAGIFDPTSPDYNSQVQQLNAETFLPVTVELTPGYYSVVSWNDWNWNSYGGANPWTTTNDGGGLIAFDGSGRYAPAHSCLYYPSPCDATYFGFPTIVDEGPAVRYQAGSFQYMDELLYVPEPSTVALIGIGLLSVWILPRRRRLN